MNGPNHGVVRTVERFLEQFQQRPSRRSPHQRNGEFAIIDLRVWAHRYGRRQTSFQSPTLTGSAASGAMNFCLADGSVRVTSSDVDSEVFRRVSLANDGESVDLD